jgi:hypothetical protein
MQLPPSAHETRTSGNGRVSTQNREKICIVDWALDAVSFWKLKIGKPDQYGSAPSNPRDITPTVKFAR